MQKTAMNSFERETSCSEWESSACTHEQSSFYLFEGWKEREVIVFKKFLVTNVFPSRSQICSIRCSQ
jgi:hypothetical protein